MKTSSDSQREYIKRTKEARLSSGKKQEEIARFIGIERTTYTNYEINRPMPGKYLSKFCKITGVNERWLISGNGAMRGQDEDPWLREANEELQKISDEKRAALMDVLRNWPKK